MDTVVSSHFSINSTRVPWVAPLELNSRLGRPDAPLILDVRRQAKFDESPRMVAGARRCDPDAIVHFIEVEVPREVVVYCVYGHNVSAGAVAQLNAAGWNARALAGGIEGGQVGVDAPDDIARWRAQPVLSMLRRADWGVSGAAPSQWITRERPKIDRIACPWLVRRFIDSRAVFHYAPTPLVLAQARQLNAIAFDIPGAPVSHVGDECSFDAVLKAFDLRDPALDVLATVVRGADTDRLSLAPQAAGLLALSLGLSNLYAADDAAMLEAAMPLYDALYAWCRQQGQGKQEPHNWVPQNMQGMQA